jgi:hypothetical protein
MCPFPLLRQMPSARPQREYDPEAADGSTSNLDGAAEATAGEADAGEVAEGEAGVLEPAHLQDVEEGRPPRTAATGLTGNELGVVASDHEETASVEGSLEMPKAEVGAQIGEDDGKVDGVVDRDEDEDEDEDEDKDDYVPPWLIGRGHCAQDPQHEKLMYIMYGSKLSPHGSMFGSYMGRY